jgi:hypothetical protein
MDTLEEKIQEVEKDLANKNTNTATRAVWQKNTGQAFLHEMMHLPVVGQPDGKSMTPFNHQILPTHGDIT